MRVHIFYSDEYEYVYSLYCVNDTQHYPIVHSWFSNKSVSQSFSQSVSSQSVSQ